MRQWIIIVVVVFSGPIAAMAGDVNVRSEDELATALQKASAGDVVYIAPGTYELTRKHRLKNKGTVSKPIVLRARKLGDVRLRSKAVELFKVFGSHWIFENLIIQGVCKKHDRCEHAFQIVGAADGTIIRNNHLRDFNAAIKGSGYTIESKRYFPARVLIEGNAIFNATPRKTANPVTPIDVVGGKGWIVRGNFIADFAKDGGNGVSYGAFLKGNSRNGILERNLVMCEWRHKGMTRVGLSLGGGGTGKKYCVNQNCATEHTNGTIRNNIILNCPKDVAIYLNKAKATKIYHNTLYKTRGIDVRFDASAADVWNNLLSGDIRRRDGGVHVEMNNTPIFMRRFKNPRAGNFNLLGRIPKHDKGIRPEKIRVDFCGKKRPKVSPDIGAIEYGAKSCDTAAILRKVKKLHPDL
jgi:hypothetical protein